MNTKDAPPAPVTLIDRLRAIEPGASLLLDGDLSMLNSARSTLTRIKKEHPDREFTTRLTDEGVRVWRLT